jgi:hypothetical protein
MNPMLMEYTYQDKTSNRHALPHPPRRVISHLTSIFSANLDPDTTSHSTTAFI